MLTMSPRRLIRLDQFSLGGLGNCATPGTWPCCVTGPTKFCITVCPGLLPLYGAVVTVVGQGSCTTDATGCCTIAGLASGTYTVTVTSGGTTIYSASRSITAGSTVTIGIAAPSNIICCGGYYIPYSLTATDALGPFSLQYCSACSGTFPTWTGGRVVTKSSCPILTNPPCNYNVPSSGPVRVCYSMQCRTSTSPHFQLTRSWASVVFQGDFTNHYFQDSSPISPGSPCAVSAPAGCGQNNNDSATGTANPSSSSPFAISFTMADGVGNTLPDPISAGGGDTVSVSQ